MSLEWAWPSANHRCFALSPEIRLEGDAGCHVMLLHGLTGAPVEFAYVAHYLHKRAHLDVWCPTLLNHGGPIHVLAATGRDALYASVRSQFDDARHAAAATGSPLVIGGLSIGADLALMLAAEFPEAVAGVICLAPTLFYDGWNVPWTHRFIPLADWTPFKYFAYHREEPPYGLKDEVLRARVANDYAGKTLNDGAERHEGYAHYPVRLMCEMHHLIKECRRMLPRVKAPLLVIQAEHDDATSPRNAQYILDHAGSVKKEVLLLENSYHVVTVDLERARVAAAMHGFCNAILDASMAASRTPTG